MFLSHLFDLIKSKFKFESYKSSELVNHLYSFIQNLFEVMRSFVLAFAVMALVPLSTCNPQGGSKKERTEEEKKSFREWAEKHNKGYASLEAELEGKV